MTAAVNLIPLRERLEGWKADIRAAVARRTWTDEFAAAYDAGRWDMLEQVLKLVGDQP